MTGPMKNKGGRPRLAEELRSAPLSIKIEKRLLDCIDRAAASNGISRTEEVSRRLIESLSGEFPELLVKTCPTCGHVEGPQAAVTEALNVAYRLADEIQDRMRETAAKAGAAAFASCHNSDD